MKNFPSMQPGDDLSALAWVHDELRRSLETAHKALRRFVKESEAAAGSDLGAVDPAVLRIARSQMHQCTGALEMIGLPAAATVLRASETLLQRIVAKPHLLTPALIADVEHASFALLDYLGRLLVRKPVSPLAMFAQYRAVQEAAGAERVHPADLWRVDWQWRDLPLDTGVASRQPDATTRALFESQLLVLMKAPSAAVAAATAAHMGDLCAGLGRGASQAHTATLWTLASAVFEAQAQNLLGFDVFSKRVASRLLAQFRALERGENNVSERLAQDLLFFCAQSALPGDDSDAGAPRLTAVRRAYDLVDEVATDYAVSLLGQSNPAVIAQARKRVAAAKEAWSTVASGEMHRLTSLSEQFALVGESLRQLFAQGEVFAVPLQQAAVHIQQANAAPDPALAMEVATSLLCIEAALEDGDFDPGEQDSRLQHLAGRLDAVFQGHAPEAPEKWMEALYRRVSDRHTMGSVVQELRASLSEIEKLIDQFFRNPTDPAVLALVPGQLSLMRGVLSMLDMDHASATLLHIREEIEGWLAAGLDPRRGTPSSLFDPLADNLSALGFLIDMLGVQPQMAQSLFSHDVATGALIPALVRHASNGSTLPADAALAAHHLIEQAQLLAFNSVRTDVSTAEVVRGLERLSLDAHAGDQPALVLTVRTARQALDQAQGVADVSSARGKLSEALVDFVTTAAEPAGLNGPVTERFNEPRIRTDEPAFTLNFNLSGQASGWDAPLIVEPAPGLHPAPDGALPDDEIREIFLEEAREVLTTACAARALLGDAPDDLALLTTLRRAFHTLKGSSRMVGLDEFGEAAWACEELYSAQLAEVHPTGAPLLDFTTWCLDYLAAWVDAVAAHRSGLHDVMTVKAAAELVTLGATHPLATTAHTSYSGLMLDLPSEFDPDVRDFPASAPLEAAEILHLDFEFDAPHAQVNSVPSPSAPMLLPDVIEEAGLDLPLELIGPGIEFDSPASWAAPRFETPSWTSFASTVDAVPVLDVDPDIDPGVDFDLNVDSGSASTGTGTGTSTEFGTEFAAWPSAIEDDLVRNVGPLRVSIPLFNIFLHEADELSRRLSTELAEWAMELPRPIDESTVALAHSLAGSSATVGFDDLSQLARTLEHALARSLDIGHGTVDEARLFVDAAEEIRRLLHQFAAGFLKMPPPELLARLAEHEHSSALRLEGVIAASELPQVSQSAPLPTTALDSPERAFPPVAELVMDTAPSDLPTAPAGAVATAYFGGRVAPIRFDSPALTELKPFGDFRIEPERVALALRERVDGDESIDAVDAIDPDLFPIFEEEAEELLHQLGTRLRGWLERPMEAAHPAGCMRTLHTLKGGARLAGAMRLGEMAHQLESRIERLLAQSPITASDVEVLESHGDAISHAFDALRAGDRQAQSDAEQAFARTGNTAQHDDFFEAQAEPPTLQAAPADITETIEAIAGMAPEMAPLDWSGFAARGTEARKAPERLANTQSSVRVRASALDRLVNQAGEVSITRSRIESGVTQIKGALGDLTENLERLRVQLRDIEFHGETQMSSRLEASKAADLSFDPLEFDRFTRFQELTRMMAESVNDVATVQRSVQRALEVTEDELVAQARLTRDLQDDLLRTRMVEFEGLSDRLYRVLRLAAKETGKSVRLDIVGGAIEVDRAVLDRMTGSFEHLLRNCVAHGIEAPEVRRAAGKAPTGSIIVALSHEGNEVAVEFRDDGAGLNLERIRDKAIAQGLLAPDAQPTADELADLIFTPGFSTADHLSELAGRGVGMSVVRFEVNAMGGRMEIATTAGQGTAFRMVLPLTTAVTQVVLLRCGETQVAVPSTLVEGVRRATPAEIESAYAAGTYAGTPGGTDGGVDSQALPFFWLGALLNTSPRPAESTERARRVVVIRSAQQRIALHVDEVMGNHEVVVKNLGPQLARMPGLVGITLLASGAVTLIYNPVALATLYGEAARAAALAAPQGSGDEPRVITPGAPEVPVAPLVMVVDDSLTVRRVTQRLLLREGYRVVLAKDGLDALEKLAAERPHIVLTDIEMPRMDGFDLVRNLRADARLRDLPVIMITSRFAQKHRDHAAELGVDHYLGKPYVEDELLALVASCTVGLAVPDVAGRAGG